MTGTRARRLQCTVLGPLVAFAAIVIVAGQLLHVPVNWEQWRPATCMPGACFCEVIRGGTVRQVANTWSSLAFVLVAFWVLGVALCDRNASKISNGAGSLDGMRRTRGPSVMSARPVYPVVFAFALCVVGLGSAFYHASLTFAGQFVDVFGMYLIGTFVLVYNVGRLRPMTDSVAVGAYLLLNVVLGTALYAVPVLRRYAFAVVLLAALAVEYRVGRRDGTQSDVRYLVGALAALVAAFAVWVLDITRVVCQAESVVQGHAVWHMLGAVACGGVFAYYRSEGPGGK